MQNKQFDPEQWARVLVIVILLSIILGYLIRGLTINLLGGNIN